MKNVTLSADEGLIEGARRRAESEQHSFSWWDSLIVSAAIQGGCNLLSSEDLPHGSEFGGVRIQNPFLIAKAPGY